MKYRANIVVRDQFIALAFFCSGGVLTPAAAFTGTSLIDRLNEHGVKFTVVRCEAKE